MAITKVYRIETFQSQFAANGQAVYQDLDSHSATTVAEIAVRLSIGENLVKRILITLESQSAAIREYDATGNEFWWSSPRMAIEIFSMSQAGRDWLTQKDGEDISQLATDLGIHFGVANRLARFLQQEGLAKLIVDDA